MTEVQPQIPPQDREAERLVLGGILIDNSLLPVVDEVISTCYFDYTPHQKIYSAMLDLYNRDLPVDLVTLRDELLRHEKLENIGGMAYISSLVADVSAVTNVKHYAGIVKEKYLLRSLITACRGVVDKCFDGEQDASQLIQYAEKVVSDVAQTEGSRVVPIKDVVRESIDTLTKIATGEKKCSGVPTGFKELDDLTLGLHPGDLVIVGARPSVGKTSLCLNFAFNAAVKQNVGTLLFTIEMSKEEIANRMLAAQAGVSLKKIRSGALSKSDRDGLAQASEVLSELPIFVDDSASLTPLEMRSRAKLLKVEQNISIVMIDYLQLMEYHKKRENRQQEVTAISRSLKSMARELGVSVVAFSQLRRDPTKRTENKVPQLDDLRESGSLEQDADVVLFLHDPSRAPKKDGKDETKRPAAVEIEIIVAKQRNGPTGKLKLLFQTKYACFKNISSDAPPPWVTEDEEDTDFHPPEDDAEDFDF